MKQVFAQRYNRQTGRIGHIWGDRYWSLIVEDAEAEGAGAERGETDARGSPLYGERDAGVRPRTGEADMRVRPRRGERAAGVRPRNGEADIRVRPRRGERDAGVRPQDGKRALQRLFSLKFPPQAATTPG
jgi:hypothetical protein